VVLDRLGDERRLERWVGHISASWRPARDLPPHVQAPPPVAPPGVWTFTGDAIGIALIILWVTGSLDTVLAQLWGVDTVLDKLWAVAHVKLVAPAPVLGWPVLVIVVAQTALHGMAALKLLRTPLTDVLFAGVKIVMLITLLVLLRHWPWLQIVDLPPAEAANAARGVNIGLGIAFGLIALVTAGGLLRDVSSLVQASRANGSSLPSR
jgi:hypothetical protein